MKLKSLVSAVAAAGMMALAAAPTQAQILDSWQLDLNGAGINSLSTNIGHLGLQSGGATVNQQVNGLGQVFIGAKFSEFGTIFSVNYTPNNVVGSGDSGLPAGLNNGAQLEFVFSGLQGTVVSLAGPGFGYAFTPGAGTIELRQAVTNVHLAWLSVVNPSNGSFNNNVGAVGSVGDSTLLSAILPASYTSNLFRDSSGASLDDAVNHLPFSDLLLNVVTHNTIAQAPNAIVNCTGDNFNPGDQCLVVRVTSDGAADLFRVPEPDSLGLLGIGLLGVVAGLRRRKAKVVA